MQKSEGRFFDISSIDEKTEVKVEKCTLVAEVKLKLEVTFKDTFYITFYIYGPFVKKTPLGLRFLKDGLVVTISGQM